VGYAEAIVETRYEHITERMSRVSDRIMMSVEEGLRTVLAL
jgi:hypothetical protein